MTDQQLINLLIARNERVTQQFFFKDCRPLFMSIIHHIFHDKAEYDELINELYLHLMEDDARRLRQFEGRSSIYQWLKTTAIRFFLEKRDEMIENDSQEHLLQQVATTHIVEVEQHFSSKLDVENLLAHLPNRRYAYVIQRLVIEDAKPQEVANELGVTVDNLYNIKKRAIAAITTIALKKVEAHER